MVGTMRKHLSILEETAKKLEEIMREKAFLTGYDTLYPL